MKSKILETRTLQPVNFIGRPSRSGLIQGDAKFHSDDLISISMIITYHMLTGTRLWNHTWCTRTVCHCVLFASADVYQSWLYLYQSIESKVSGWSWHLSFKQSRIRNHGLSKHWIWNLWSITVTVPAHKKVDQVESVGTWEGGSMSPCPVCTKFTNSFSNNQHTNQEMIRGKFRF